MSVEVNDSKHWREFERNPLSHSMAHYLMAIDSLRHDLGYARSTDVADMLEVSRGAASMALSQLKKRGWVAEDPNRFLLLTEEGERIARSVEHNFVILTAFFEQLLQVDSETARGDACKMEHLMSMDSGKRLLWLMHNLMQDPAAMQNIQQIITEYRPNWNPEAALTALDTGDGHVHKH